METLSNGFAFKRVSQCEVGQKGVIRKPGVSSSYHVLMGRFYIILNCFAVLKENMRLTRLYHKQQLYILVPVFS